MSILPLVIQGALIGMIAQMAYPGHGWEFWAAIAANSILTAAYGAMKAAEV